MFISLLDKMPPTTRSRSTTKNNSNNNNNNNINNNSKLMDLLNKNLYYTENIYLKQLENEAKYLNVFSNLKHSFATFLEDNQFLDDLINDYKDVKSKSYSQQKPILNFIKNEYLNYPIYDNLNDYDYTIDLVNDNIISKFINKIQKFIFLKKNYVEQIIIKYDKTEADKKSFRLKFISFVIFLLFCISYYFLIKNGFIFKK